MASLRAYDASEFARLSQELLAEQGRQNTLQAAVEQAVTTIAGADFAGVTVALKGTPSTPASTDPLVDRLDAYPRTRRRRT